ncbi:unnamed protein product [Ilex paraguariensis]|uniref:Uncharacterized protein n=1 Tax=Ilex paraguariensis TaxID=185542 RepID=A0ABC8S8D3_9AQUA
MHFWTYYQAIYLICIYVVEEDRWFMPVNWVSWIILLAKNWMSCVLFDSYAACHCVTEVLSCSHRSCHMVHITERTPCF